MDKKLFVLSLPTGIGAQCGGYAGDMGYIAREFANHFDLVVNPNVVNGGILSAITPNMHYTEGWAMDRYLSGEIFLTPTTKNRIGVVFDSEIPQKILNIHINTINAMKMVMGLDIIGYEITKNPVGVELNITDNVSAGSLKNPKELLAASKKLLQKGADAIAIICLFPDAEDELYMQGVGIDPIGGLEGVISHFISSELMTPTAHAPAFNSLDISFKIENPKLASETISPTYLPCVLIGLNQAPAISHNKTKNSLKKPDGLIVPSSALGSYGVLGAIKNNIPIYAIKNKCSLEVSKEKLGIEVFEFESYKECLNYLL